jgi:peroxiredoxin Q/BCP
MPLPSIGNHAPAFTRPDQFGRLHNLSDYKGKWIVTYFYPKALTSGCTTQACTLRDNMTAFKALNCVILGISPDAPTLLKKFIEKEELNFTLLSDADHTMADAYGAWQEKSMYGRTYVGMARMTVLIDPNGVVQAVWPKVKPEQHAEDILVWFKSNKM